MWQKARYQLIGLAPLIHNNGQKADPLNKWAKLIKVITSKKNKTDADYEEVARLEFMAALYMTESGPVIPAKNIESMLNAAARRRREGPIARPGMYVDEHALLKYDGPRAADELWADKRFVLSELVTGSSRGKTKVVRTRPIFSKWQCVITVNYDDEQVDLSVLDIWVTIAGDTIGLCDWRPKYGRFEVRKL